MQEKLFTFNVGICVYVLNPRGVKRRHTTHNAVNLIALQKQKLGKITPVLPSNPCYQSFRHRVNPGTLYFFSTVDEETFFMKSANADFTLSSRGHCARICGATACTP